MYNVENEYRILIVEDGHINQKILKDTLQSNYQIAVAENGKQALKSIVEFKPHLILLDIILPDMNGFALLRKLKESDATRSIAVIIITGLDSDADEEKGLVLGAVDYIKKPFNSTIVKARVRTHLQILKQIETIEQQSFMDALTGLPNRRKFNYQIEYEWNRSIRKQTCVSLIMMDLDNFKNYNDTYGHTQGDIMLQQVAEVMKNTLKRSTDFTCRWGGEEFAALFPETSCETAIIMAEKIRQIIANKEVPCINSNTITKMTVSMGVCSATPKKGDSLVSFIEKADQLLYEAKKRGKNQVFY